MGERDTFTEFVVTRRTALLRSAVLLTGDQGLAEDLVQTALSRVAARWGTVVAAGDPEPYVRRTMYHAHVSSWRRRRVVEVLGEPPATGAGAQATPTTDADVRVDVRNALARLTRKQRAVLVLRYFEDLSESQTAAVLGCSVGTVKSQARDALARIRVVAPELSELVEPTTAEVST